MELQTISQVSKDRQVSTRTLRYYEQIGLIQSKRVAGYAYRVYDEEALYRLEIIRLLRKMRISLKQIASILSDPRCELAVEVFRREVKALDGEMAALSTIREILRRLIDALSAGPVPRLEAALLNDGALRGAIDSISAATTLKKEEISMEELNQADQALSKLTDVRIVYLPPATVACSHYIGEDPEMHAFEQLNDFIKKVELWDRKPDARMFGFNHPNPTQEKPIYGYEAQITIPEDIEVPEPLTKQAFAGGLYAAHMIVMGNFHEWELLYKWVEQNPKMEYRYPDDGGERMGGCLEEGINHIYYQKIGGVPAGMEDQLDLLIPIKLL